MVRRSTLRPLLLLAGSALLVAACTSTPAGIRTTTTTTLGQASSTTAAPTVATYPRLATMATPTGCTGSTFAGDPFDPPSQLRECPAHGPVGTVVTLAGAGCTFPGRAVVLRFLGPTDYQGSGGGGELVIAATGRQGRFSTTFRIPPTVVGGGLGPVRKVAVTPGPAWFVAQPTLRGCGVKFTVTAS